MMNAPTYTYTIWDNDVGGEVHSESGICMEELLSIVAGDLEYDWEADIEFEDEPEKLKAEAQAFDTASVRKSLRDFNFAGGFAEWHVRLPGHHRKFIVNQDALNS